MEQLIFSGFISWVAPYANKWATQYNIPKNIATYLMLLPYAIFFTAYQYITGEVEGFSILGWTTLTFVLTNARYELLLKGKFKVD